MFLERINDEDTPIVIYSENRFDFENNFRLIRKDHEVKVPINISYNEVCRYLTDGTLKNLVVYRILTNLDKFDFNYVKYGVVVKINGIQEVIYFDPVYAIKELESGGFLSEDPELRVRIQQVGLQSDAGDPEGISFNESYAFDMEAIEIQKQNDRSFAELIFAFDNINFDELDSTDSGLENTAPAKKLPPASERFTKITSDHLPGGKSTGKVSESGMKGVKSLSFERKVSGTGIFEEDSSFDPRKTVKVMVIDPNEAAPKRVGANTSVRIRGEVSSEQSGRVTGGQQSRFQILGRSEGRPPERTPEIRQTKPAQPEEDKPKSSLSAYLNKKRQEVKENRPAGSSEEQKGTTLSQSFERFVSGRDNRMIVLKIRK